jgi:hypothetical protein
MTRTVIAAAAAAVLATANAAHADPFPHVRFQNARIGEALDVMTDRSAAFRAIVAELDASDLIAYVDEGRCVPGIRSCLRIFPTSGRLRFVRIHLDTRQHLATVVGQIAHELQHAVEVARRPDVVDGASLRALYREIGYRSCAPPSECFETIGAQDLEATVVRDVQRGRRQTSVDSRQTPVNSRQSSVNTR